MSIVPLQQLEIGFVFGVHIEQPRVRIAPRAFPVQTVIVTIHVEASAALANKPSN